MTSQPTALHFSLTKVTRDLIEALTAGDELVAVYGGIRSGKSYAIPIACLFLCQTRRELNVEDGTTKPIDILITRRTAGDIKRSLLKAFRHVLGTVGARFIDNKEWCRWELPNGSTITWAAYQLHATQGESESTLEGLGFSVIFGDEATQYPDEFFSHTIERASQPSVEIGTGRRFEGQVVWLSRPAHDDRFLREAKRRFAEGTPGRIIISRTRDNPSLGPGYLAKQRRNRSKREFEAITQEVPGSTYPATGAIFSGVFKAEAWPAGNIIDLPIDKSYPTILAIDPSVNHTACLWLQHHVIDGQPVAVIVDEWHPPPPCRAADIVREAHRRGWALSEAVIDPAGDARNPAAISTAVQVLRRPADSDHAEGPGLGCPVRSVIPPPRRGVKDGIYKLMTRFEAADGTRSLLVRRQLIDSPEFATGIRHTLDVYSWGPDGEPVKGAKGKESDHAADALRYWCVFHAWTGPPGSIPSASGQPAPPVAAMFGRR